MQQGYAAVLCEYSWGTGGMASGVTSVGVPEGADTTGFGCSGVLAVLGLEAAAPGECELTRLLQDKLQYEMRLQYMKHYFPIDYTVQVQYEEVLRPSNITRLRNGTVSEAALRYLWFHVSSQAVLRIREVLPEKHPSWKYTQELCQLFDALGEEYSKYRQVRLPPGTPAQLHVWHSCAGRAPQGHGSLGVGSVEGLGRVPRQKLGVGSGAVGQCLSSAAHLALVVQW
uniref:Interleukin 34 n=1 Tax=Taeniopygia guttata TaxID=59729 RepID=A0A674HBV9_TAEGU